MKKTTKKVYIALERQESLGTLWEDKKWEIPLIRTDIKEVGCRTRILQETNENYIMNLWPLKGPSPMCVHSFFDLLIHWAAGMDLVQTQYLESDVCR
jgi:hypothetical protein